MPQLKVKPERILVGVDDSSDAQKAFKYALKRCIKEKATLIITTIFESDEMNVYQALSLDYIHQERYELESDVKKYRQIALKAGVKHVEEIIAEGDSGETIVKKIIPTVKPDVLIIGSLSKRGFAKYFGSPVSYIASHSPISVIVVR